MSLSPEIAAAVDEIRRTKSVLRSQQAASRLQSARIAELEAKVNALPVGQPISAEDKEALQREVSELDALNDELEAAVPANTIEPEVNVDQAAQEAAEERGRQKEAGPAEVEHIQAPLMPTLAFDPSGGNSVAPQTGAAEPAQPIAIETPGGFVIQGGASTQRAPGSAPESPSSTLVVPAEAVAAADANVADPSVPTASEPAPAGGPAMPPPNADTAADGGEKRGE